jgi:glycosyltransferase involved in cell wall biosynthesis
MTIDVIYCAWNRLAYTARTFELLLQNTAWERVRRLHVYDDGSTDGTLDYLAARIHQCPGAYVLHDRNPGDPTSPVAAMNDYLLERSDGADYFAKVDNDIAMPAGWLDQAAEIMDYAGGSLDLLGLAAGWNGSGPGETPGWQHATHIGGVGLMRVGAFTPARMPIGYEGRQGFTQWQHRHPVRAGWITPDVQAVQLDLVPADPYQTLGNEYRRVGWQRRWPPYAHEAEHWKWVLE